MRGEDWAAMDQIWRRAQKRIKALEQRVAKLEKALEEGRDDDAARD